MKKIIITLATAILLSLGSINVMAQGDGFFSNWTDYRAEGYDPTAPVIDIPDSHGSNSDYQAPLGSGLMILAGLGIAYGVKKKVQKR